MPSDRNNKSRPRSVTSAGIRAFRRRIYDYYDRHGRDLPWRRRPTGYRVVVSEIMLQQTQVDRVRDKFGEFLGVFPGFPNLAEASAAKLIAIWSGMGYNRRALALRALARKVLSEHRGRLPGDFDKLLALPGIGKYTAGAVLAFAFNRPVVFLDTNIRRVFIHEFFHDRNSVHDDDIIPLIQRTMDRKNPRRWYNALMDYGSMLVKEHRNPNRRSAHYQKQSPFENSNRQVRGRIVKLLVKNAPLTFTEIVKQTGIDSGRVKANLAQLEAEGFAEKKGRTYTIPQ